MAGSTADFEDSDTLGARILVVLLHSYTGSASKLDSVKAAVLQKWPSARTLVPELPASLFSLADPDAIVADLLARIDALVEEAGMQRRPVERIVLIGHSLGALLARKLYVVACGEGEGARFEDVYRAGLHGRQGVLVAPRPWAGKVSRIVLLAGMNRGWRVSHHLSLLRAPLWAAGGAIGHAIHLVRRRWPLIFTIRRGAEFITQLRIQWVLMRQRANGLRHESPRMGGLQPGSALAIQLLGSRDDMVSPEDNVDLVSGGDFIYLDVPFSGHADVIEFDDATAGKGRRDVFDLALAGSVARLQNVAVVPSDEAFSAPNLDVKRVVFVIHGIRDVGYWTHKIARRVKQRAGSTIGDWATETSSYGYFPMLPFLLPWYRRNRVEWLMDQYTEALARYPNASFSYVGHSNGTYLLARALELYPSCKFDNIVFAGSVVRTRYDWGRFLHANPPRVNAVLNFTATSDWVVAIFPKLFQFLRLQDLGSAGHDGFELTSPTPGVYELGPMKGGHGAAIAEPVWDVIANFVRDGRPATTKLPGTAASRSLLVTAAGWFPPLVWAGILYALWWVWTRIEQLVCSLVPDPSTQGFATGLSLAAYLLFLWLVVTRV